MSVEYRGVNVKIKASGDNKTQAGLNLFINSEVNIVLIGKYAAIGHCYRMDEQMMMLYLALISRNIITMITQNIQLSCSCEFEQRETRGGLGLDY